MNLSTLREKLNEPVSKIVILILLIASLSFGLGYLSGRDWNPAPIVIEKNSTN